MTKTSPAASSAWSVPVSLVAAAVGALDPLPAGCAIRAAGQPEGGDVAAGGDDHRGHRLQEADAPHRAVAAAPAPDAAGAAADREDSSRTG